MSDTESFFIPQRKRRLSTVISAEGGSSTSSCSPDDSSKQSKKPRQAHYKDGVLIIDDKAQNQLLWTADDLKSDIEFIYASSNAGALEKKKESALVAACWAINMYLEPANVMLTTIYWLSQYVNFKLPESQWFNDHIRGLMINPVRLDITSSQGIAHIHARLPKYTLLLHLAGSNLHKVPSEYYVHNDCVQILEGLDYFLHPHNECFLTKNNFGLKGEIELATFQYNRVLSYFYEPSFHIMMSYLVYVNQLLLLPHGRHLNFFLPRIRNICKPLEHKRIPWETLLCLDQANTNYIEKRQVFEEDLIELRLALSHLEVDKVVYELTSLCSRKATYVTDCIEKRYEAIYSQLYT